MPSRLRVSSGVTQGSILGPSFFVVLYRVRNFRGRVSYFNQSEARKGCFLASDWLKYETLPRKFRTLFINEISNGPSSGTNITSYADYTQIWRETNCEEDNNNLLSLAVRNKMKIHPAKYKVQMTVSDPNSRSPSLGILPCIRTHTQWEIPCWISTTLTPKKISGFL